MVSSLPPKKIDGGGVIFQGQWGVCFFIWAMGELLYMGGVTVSNFPGGTPVLISCPIGKSRTKVCKSKFNKLSQRSL